MEKFIFIYTVFCFMTVHLKFSLSENINRDDGDVVTTEVTQQVTEPSLFLLLNNANRNNFDIKISLPNLLAENKLKSGSDFRNVTEASLQSSLNINVDKSDVTFTTLSTVDVNTEMELLPLFIDFESPKHSNDNVVNNSAIRHVNKVTEVVDVTSEPRGTVKKNENIPDDEDEAETKTSSNKKDHIDKDNLFDQENTDNDEDYDDDEDSKEDTEVDKKDDTGILGDYDNNDGDEDYSVTKWTEKNDGDVDNDKDYEDDNDGDDDDDFDESKNQKTEGIVDELPKKSKPLTAPTSMVLFYTWMIVAVLIILVGISTYRSHCKGIRFYWTKGSSNPKDDRKRLIEHEFV